MNNKKLSEYSLIFLAFLALIYLLGRFHVFMRPLIIASILAFLFTPFYRANTKEKLKKIGRISLGILVAVIIIGTMTFSIFGLVNDLRQDQAFKKLGEADFVTAEYTVAGRTFSISNWFQSDKAEQLISNSIQSLFSSVIAFSAELILILLIMLFMMPVLGKKLPEASGKFKEFALSMEDIVRNYLKAKTWVSFGTAIVSYLVLLLFGINHALLFAIIIFLFNYIPNFGDYISFAIIFGIQAFAIGLGVKFFALLAVMIAVQIIFANFIEPKIAGKTMHIEPVVVILSLVFWGALWGVGGMLFAVPLTMTGVAAYKSFLA